jgi:hypothetical protein
VDGDGTDDILLGAPMDSANDYAGVAYLHLGPPAGEVDLQDHVKLVGTLPHAETGMAVAAAGDLDGDGLDDMLIGAPAHAAAGDHAGAVFVVQGREGM